MAEEENRTNTELCSPHRQYACRECYIASQPPYVRRVEVATAATNTITFAGASWWGIGIVSWRRTGN